MRIAIANGSFSHTVNVAIDEHDELYYGMDNWCLINATFHKFRGADSAYRFVSLESMKNGERFALTVIRKDSLDDIDNAMSLGITIGMVLMDRGYLDSGVMRNVESLHLRYIIPVILYIILTRHKLSCLVRDTRS